MKAQDLPILLASASPRRRQIISQLGLPFTLGIAPGDEDAAQLFYKGPATGLAQWTALHKAVMTLTQPEAANHLVVTADTTVILDDQVLGKPRHEAHARELLLSLRGRWHHVVTGVVVSTLIDGEFRSRGASCSTPVLMRDYTEEEVMSYIATGDPMDKAGAYGIQSASFQPTERIDGCYLNVVGLPLCTLVRLLAEFDVHPATQGRQGQQCPWSEQCQR
ncbi:Maf family protein [Tengunoibacter tsumagoiensis]|uniref:dTTP/UTP pyrophosphatase n=1 Tax=Tengunoibacter tsumagoiensis TaxID=2014871 RepID=A0A402A2J4_9CHLR|nr:Maf family protein [Tengunoibacter tsumagoiensis]GCE13367.1 Maf-like protein [Tengunoibacter tsumagoiensis]